MTQWLPAKTRSRLDHGYMMLWCTVAQVLCTACDIAQWNFSLSWTFCYSLKVHQLFAINLPLSRWTIVRPRVAFSLPAYFVVTRGANSVHVTISGRILLTAGAMKGKATLSTLMVRRIRCAFRHQTIDSIAARHDRFFYVRICVRFVCGLQRTQLGHCLWVSVRAKHVLLGYETCLI